MAADRPRAATCLARRLTPIFVALEKDSAKMLADSLDSPTSRWAKLIGISMIEPPSWWTLSVMSVWKKYPEDSTDVKSILRRKPVRYTR